MIDSYKKLMAKGATDRQAAEVVAWALEIGLLNEEEYHRTVDDFIRRRLPATI